MVETIDHKFLVSGHSCLPNDQNFGLAKKNKKYHQNVPIDRIQVVREARKKTPFNVVVMRKTES